MSYPGFGVHQTRDSLDIDLTLEFHITEEWEFGGQYYLSTPADYAYDGSGNLVKVSNANDGTVYWQPESGAGYPAMNALGQMQTYVLSGALDVERLHDAATGAVTSITSGPNGSGSVLNLTYGYNASGSMDAYADLNEGLTESDQYDTFQRLKKVTRTASGGNSSSSSFYYGAAGQFTQGPEGSYSYGSFPAHSPSSTAQNGTTTNYSYGTDGGRTQGRLLMITWDALGKVRSMEAPNGTGFNLVYGPDGQLVENTGPDGGRYLGPFLKEQDSNDWSARIVVQGKVIAVVKDTGGSVSTNYLIDNSLGSTAAVATGGGSLTQRIATGAWGQFVRPATGTGNIDPTTIGAYTTVTYTGHELIAGANLINMGVRLYDPATGLFMSPDPIVAQPYNSQDLNQYAYVNDNPLSYVDPFGLWNCEPGNPDPGSAGDPCVVTGTGTSLLGLIIGGGGSGGDASIIRPESDPQALQQLEKLLKKLKKKNHCTGTARVFGNNGGPLERQMVQVFLEGKPSGGAFGMFETPDTANIDPAQFGLSISQITGYVPFISGIVSGPNGPVSFNGVTDVIGGAFGTPVAGINTREGSEQRFPGDLLIELNSGPDLGVAQITLSIPSALSCPSGTSPSSASSG